MAESVDRVVGGGSGDQGLRRELHPSGKRSEGVEHRCRVDTGEVREEDTVET